MRKTLLLFALAFSMCFALNVSAVPKESAILITVDGDHSSPYNLTIFVLRDGVQLRGMQKNDVLLPYRFEQSHNGSGFYEFRAVSEQGERADASLNLTVPSGTITPGQQAAEDQRNTEYAIIIGLVGILVLVFLLLRFLNMKSDNK